MINFFRRLFIKKTTQPVILKPKQSSVEQSSRKNHQGLIDPRDEDDDSSNVSSNTFGGIPRFNNLGYHNDPTDRGSTGPYS